jgi:hypothetical protein
MVSKDFINFMLEISEDPEKLDAFQRSPDSVLSSVNISFEEKETIISGDKDKMQELICSSLLTSPNPVTYV